MENIKLLFQLYFRPAWTMSEIIDKGSWLFAAVLVLLVSIAFFATINTKLHSAYTIPHLYEFYNPEFTYISEDSPEFETAYRDAQNAYQTAMNNREKIPLIGDNFFRFFSFEPSGFFQPLLSLSCFYVPIAILLMCVFGGGGSFGVVLRRDYGALATCSLMAWAAAHLPFAAAGILLYSAEVSPQIFLAMWFASGLLFGVFMIFALRTVFGASYATAILVVCVAWLAFSLGMYVFRYVSPWLFSPFLLFFAFIYLGGYLSGEARGFGNAFRQRQSFKRFLHNATVNPRDADAHVQLALIYLQRKQEAKALEHLKKAVEIDKEEIDANYELGKIARAKGNLQEALNHFSTVVEQNDKHALSEIWREIGATYMEAGMLTEAREALEKFVERRPVDSEGLYYLGKVLKAQNEPDRAREMFEQAIESARNSPDYRHRELRYWSKQAKKEI
ncbi:MAG TPA: tetratricopeptide repeat protein [Pyrinomonadaceae bacterium]|nr:tetratricopeptide repeat protein [Pyrinomonadaceae bacterium]